MNASYKCRCFHTRMQFCSDQDLGKQAVKLCPLVAETKIWRWSFEKKNRFLFFILLLEKQFFLMGKMMIKVIWCCLLLSQMSGWNVSIKQVIKFTPVAEPAQKPGSYKETLRSVWFPGWNYFVYAWSGGSLTGSGFPIWNLYIFISGWDTKQKFIQQ